MNVKLISALIVLSIIVAGSPVQADWEQLNGPLGGIVNVMTYHQNRLLATLYSGGIYEFKDGGRWSQIAINAGLPENRTFDLTTSGDTIYATQMIACGAKSTDGGETWEGLCDPILAAIAGDNYSSEAVVIDPDDSNTVYLFGHDQDNLATLLVSADAGDSWVINYTFSDAVNFTDAVFYHDQLWVSTRAHGVYVSADSGSSFTAASDGLAADTTIGFVMDTDRDRLYLGNGLVQYNIRTGGAVYQLADDETSWEVIDAPDNVTGVAYHDAALWLGTDTGEFWKYTTAAGAQQRNAEDVLPCLISEIVFSEDDIIVGCGGYGLFRSIDDGQHWTISRRGLSAIATRQTVVHPTRAKKLYVVTWDRPGIYFSNNGGDSFSFVDKDMYVTRMATQESFKKFYAGGIDFFDVKKTKHGWKATTHNLPGPAAGRLTAVAVHPANPDRVLAGIGKGLENPAGYGLYYSKNRGADWKRAIGIPHRAVTAIIYHPTKPNIVYAAAFGKGVYKSRDGGRTFSQINDTRLKYTYRLAMSPDNPKVLVASSNLFFAGLSNTDQTSGEYGGIFQTRSAGRSWTEITASIRDYEGDDGEPFELWKYNFGHLPNYEELLIDPNDPDHIIVGHHGESVILTRDGGDTWEKQASGMITGDMHNYAYCLATNESFKTIYACSCGRGLFKGTVAGNGTISDAAGSITSRSVQSVAQAHQWIQTSDYVHEH